MISSLWVKPPRADLTSTDMRLAGSKPKGSAKMKVNVPPYWGVPAAVVVVVVDVVRVVVVDVDVVVDVVGVVVVLGEHDAIISEIAMRQLISSQTTLLFIVTSPPPSGLLIERQDVSLIEASGNS
jgi:hypothetical protein